MFWLLDLCGFISDSSFTVRQHVEGMDLGAPLAICCLYYWTGLYYHVSIPQRISYYYLYLYRHVWCSDDDVARAALRGKGTPILRFLSMTKEVREQKTGEVFLGINNLTSQPGIIDFSCNSTIPYFQSLGCLNTIFIVYCSNAWVMRDGRLLMEAYLLYIWSTYHNWCMIMFSHLSASMGRLNHIVVVGLLERGGGL